MTPLNLEYVISATGSMGIFSNPVYSDYKKELEHFLLGSMDILKQSVRSACIHTSPRVATLYNGYTEAGMASKLIELKNIGAESMYSDSGGLQIVTAGKSITPELKEKIYKAQSVSDYAMCFDEIPLERTTEVQTINERSNVGNKIFDQSRHAEAGRLTGLNIKEQIKKFRELKAKTKVIMIIQGNCAEDMVLYFDQIQKQLSNEDYEYIGGMAVADTCIGNGELESIEMLRGAREISKVCHPAINNHLHILGVGSIYRMRPILYLVKSGYLDTFKDISYDSSSHTSTFRFGLLKVDGTCKSLGLTRTQRAEVHFARVYDLFKPILSSVLTLDRFLDIILLDGALEWNFANVKKNAANFSGDEMTIAFLGNALHTYYQIDNFIKCLDKVFEEEMFFDDNYREISMLQSVKTDDDMKFWMKQFKNHVSSKRIKRKENYATLEGMFNDN